MTVMALNDTADAVALSRLAAELFPLACPADLGIEQIREFVDANLSPDRFAEYLASPDDLIHVAVCDDVWVGYTLVQLGQPVDPAIAAAAVAEPAAYLSKCYVRPVVQGTGIAGDLMSATLRAVDESGARSCWLGVNQLNARAVRFYSRHDFRTAGVRTFTVGSVVCDDFVMVRQHSAPPTLPSV